MEKKPLVLIADDNTNILVLLRRLFERDGFVVESVLDGMTALDQAEMLRPDLILVDVQMPGIDGFEVVRRLRQNEITARIPTIFLTAVAREPTDVAKGLGLGADDYVFKPFNPHELLARARSKIRARQLEEQLERRKVELEALVRIGREFNQQMNLDELLDLILSVCTTELPAEQALLALLDDRVGLMAWRVLDDAELGEAQVRGFLTDSDSLLTQMLDKEDSLLLISDEDVFLPPNSHTIIGTRIMHRGDLLGIIVLGHSDPTIYDEDHIRLLESVTEQAALAIRNAELYAELQQYASSLEEMVEERTAELRSAQQQLIRSEKLAAVGRLSAGIAHEVNNPLQAIRNCLELAIEDIDADRLVEKELLEVAEEDVQRIQRIVRRLLDFARPGSGEMITLDVSKLVSEVLRLVEPQLARSDVKIVKDIPDTLKARVDEDHLKQVLLNLTLNAKEAMPEGGTLTVGVSQSDDQLLIRFEDTGVGIPEENLSMIFDPFFSTKEEGTGLGLAVSYGIIEGHGGYIEVESIIDQGTKFTVVLPVH